MDFKGHDSPLPSEEQSTKVNTLKYGDLQIAAFSDDMRDGIKGHVFEDQTAGFVNGFDGLENVVKFGIVASTKHDDVALTGGPNQFSGYGTVAWANQPYQTVNYASAHDNLTLWDKLQTTNPDATKEELIAMNKMSAALVLTSQGIPFFHAGEEIARTKVNEDGSFNHNSYNAPDSVNKIDWTRKEEYNDLFNYYKGLISLRKSHKAFRMNTTSDIQTALNFLEQGENFEENNVIAYTIDGTQTSDSWENIAVIFNSNEEAVEVTLPGEGWTLVVNEETAGVEELATFEGDTITVPAKASYVLVDTNSFNTSTEEDDKEEDKEDVKPETPEEDDKEEDKEDVKPEDSDDTSKEEGKGDLPNTGGTSAVTVLGVAGLITGLGVALFKKKED